MHLYLLNYIFNRIDCLQQNLIEVAFPTSCPSLIPKAQFLYILFMSSKTSFLPLTSISGYLFHAFWALPFLLRKLKDLLILC